MHNKMMVALVAAAALSAGQAQPAARPGGAAAGTDAGSPAPGQPASEQRWEIRAADVTLARTFERWAAAAGHKVKWDASRNFLVGASDTYVGTFEGALVHVLSSPGIRYSDYPLEACIYANTPPLVRITRQGEQSRECPSSANP